MCEYCGCRGNDAIAELMDEHHALLDEAHQVRRSMAAGDREGALAHLRLLVRHLDTHVRREEQGIFTALRDADEYVEEVELLEKEHAAFDTAIAELDPAGPDFERAVSTLFVELDEHVERENLGVFPASVVTLGASGWDRVEQARAEHPTFLDRTSPES
ncbi:MAG TPA: hemerythrin domain-containing protein [Marmoricola sp.]|nr:hemerythrin domain-containing protein [Marmoricola sp.]